MIFKVLLVIVVVLAVLYVIGLVLRERRYEVRLPPPQPGPSRHPASPPHPPVHRFTEVGELPPQWRQEIDKALAGGKKILAIKIYRDATRASLADAKTAVETYAWKHGS